MGRILFLTKEGCLPCIRIKRIIKDLQAEIPGLKIEEVDYSSQKGVELAVEYQVLYPPAVLVDGQVFKGKIWEDELKNAVRSSLTSGAK